MDLTIQREHSHGGTLVRLSGVLGEKFRPDDLTRDLGPVAVFDLDGVTRITSGGVRDWKIALFSLRLEYYCFIRSRPAITAQFNMVAGFGGHGELVSFYAPYACPACNATKDVLIDLRKNFEVIEQMRPLEVACTCGAPMEFESIPDMYFNFARSAPRPNPPAVANALIDQKPAASALRIEKEVDGEITVLRLIGNLGDRRAFKHLADGLSGDVVMRMNGVSSVTDEGVAALADFLSTKEFSPKLANLPQRIAEQLAAELAARNAGPLDLVTLDFAAVCEGCYQDVRIELDTDWFSRTNGQAIECHHCGSVLPEKDRRSLERILTAFKLVGPIERYARFLGPVSATSMGATPSRNGHSGGLVLGRYEIVRQLAEGGMAEVYLARHHGPGGFMREVVLKCIKRKWSNEKEVLSRFLREARMSSRLSHPNIVNVLDFGVENGQYVLVMEYVRGSDLRALLTLARRRQSRPTMEIAALIVRDLCAGLDAAHSWLDDQGKPCPIIHRDVSPSNVFVSLDGLVKLGDFGICKVLEGEDTDSTTEGQFWGKPCYTSPEQLRGETVDQRTDTFSAGVILYEILTLRRLFRTAEERSKESSSFPKVTALPVDMPEVPAALVRIFEKAVAHRPEDRYQSARDLRTALDEFIIGRGATSASLPVWVKGLFTPLGEETVRPHSHGKES